MDFKIPDDHEICAQAPDTIWHLPKIGLESNLGKGKGRRRSRRRVGYRIHRTPRPTKTDRERGRLSMAKPSTMETAMGPIVAGTAVGRNGIGVAPDADLIVGKVLSNQGSGGSTGIAAGIRWAVDQGRRHHFDESRRRRFGCRNKPGDRLRSDKRLRRQCCGR